MKVVQFLLILNLYYLSSVAQEYASELKYEIILKKNADREQEELKFPTQRRFMFW